MINKTRKTVAILMAIILCSGLLMPVGVLATGEQPDRLIDQEPVRANQQSPSPTITVRILYVRDNNEKNVLAKPYIATVPVGYTKTVDVPSPAVKGFTPDKQQVKLDFSSFTQDTNIEVVYSPNIVDYTVEHKIEDLNRDSYTRYQLETKHAKVEEDVVAVPLELEGFTAQKPYESGKIPADGALNLQVKYSRNVYTLSYDTDGGSYIASEQKTYEAPLMEPQAPIKAGYTFAGWEPAFPATMPAKNLELKAKWTESEETLYRFAYYIQNPDDDDYTFLGTAAKTGKTGSEIVIPVDGEGPENAELFPLDQKYASLDWYFNKYFIFNTDKTNQENDTKIIAADGSTIVNLYFDRQEYTLLMGGQPEQFDLSDSWYPEITRDGHTYKRPEVLAVKARFGQDITDLIPTDEEISNAEGRKISGRRIWENSDRFWYFSPNPPYILSEVHCYFPQEVLKTGPYANDPFALWIFLSFENEEDFYNLTLREHFQDLNGGYSTEINSKQIPMEYTDWFCKPGDYTGFSADQDKMMYIKEINWDGTYNKPSHYFIIMRDGKPSLYEGDRILNPEDGTIIKTMDVQTDMAQDGEVDVYYQRNKYPLNIYFSNQKTKPDQTLDLYFEAPILETLASVDVQGHKPDTLSDDYEFKGWYLDSGYSIKLTENDKMPEQASAVAQAVYAKWGPPEGDIEITIDADNGTETSKLTRAYGETISKADLGTPEKAGYRFMGWHRVAEDGKLGELYDFSYRVKSPFTIKAKWQLNQVSELAVRFVNEADEAVAPSLIVNDLAVGSDYTYKAALVDGMLPDKVSKNITIAADSAKNVLTFIYKPFTTVDYMIRFVTHSLNDAGSIIEKEIGDPEIVTTNKNIDTKNFQEISGYTPLTLQQTLQFSQDSAENVMTFVYKKNEPNQEGYRVEYYFEQEDGSYQLDSDRTMQLSGETGTKVTLGEELIPVQINGFSLNKEKSEISGIITSFDSLVLKIYYDLTPQPEDEYAVITFDPNGGFINGKADMIYFSYLVGEEITILDAPVRDGWRFLYWKGSEYQPGDKYKVVGDHAFTAIWEKVTKPTETTKPAETTKAAATPQTGEQSVFNSIVVILLCSMSAVFLILRKKIKHNTK